jgi:3-oxoacyl-[acyl-carrier protein] reductase
MDAAVSGAAQSGTAESDTVRGNTAVEAAVRALVTGGSGAIGAAICKRLGAAGHHVYVHAHRGTAAAEAVVAQIIAAGGKAEAIAFDVTDGAATRDALEALLERTTIQILVNNAGIHDDAAFPGMSEQQWHRVIDVSVDGFYHVTHALVLPMIRTRWGRIVNISSVASLTGNRGQVNYSAAKGALNAATKALSRELAGRGVTVNAVAPGIIATPMSAPAFDAAAIADLVPMKRAGSPDEVAGLVAYLVSREAGYVTGQIISINGGMI